MMIPPCEICNQYQDFDEYLKKTEHKCKREDIEEYVSSLVSKNRELERHNSDIIDSVSSFIVDNMKTIDDKSALVSTESLTNLYESVHPYHKGRFRNFLGEHMYYLSIIVDCFELFNINENSKRVMNNINSKGWHRFTIKETLTSLLENLKGYAKFSNWNNYDEKLMSPDELVTKIVKDT